MERIVIAGCGYVGTAVADLLHRVGWDLEAWTFSEESAARLGDRPYPARVVDITRGNLAAPTAGRATAVLHCASTRGGGPEEYRSVYAAGARNLRTAFPDARFVFTSSTSVYGQRDGEWVTEESATDPLRETGKILRETEELVVATGGVVARLAGVYGPARSALLRKFLDGSARLDPAHDRFVNQAHRDDIAAAICLLIERGNSAGIYNVVDNEPMLESECYKWLARKLDQPLPSLPEGPVAERKRGASNKRVSNAKLCELGWQPAYPTFAAGMEKSVLPNLARLGA